ncbi:hypothetical protein [Haloparvum sedimenti]|uniref:hypothetical protein n=1 Tax=Haloparvum sedimenti TaxID=1678448 RepID=UPI00071E9376|nr:hypothetical protein [Haloparvum sedimenti]
MSDDADRFWREEPSEELRRALAFRDRDEGAEAVLTRGYRRGAVAGALCGAAGVALSFLGVLPGGVVRSIALPSLLAVATALAVVHVSHRLPVWLAGVARTRALGAAPGLVGRAVLRMRIEPSLERAVAFAGGTDEGPLAASLRGHARRARGRPDAGLGAFANEWTPWFPALERATTLLRAAATAPSERRDRCLDRALDAVVAGADDRMAAFVGDVRGPVSGIYAFGVLLPLALVALLPAASAAGVPVGAATMATVYVVLLPAGLCAAGGWLLLRRPVAFPPPRITADHPDVSTRSTSVLGAGVIAGTGSGAVAGLAVAEWAVPVAVVGVGGGTALFVVARPRRRVLERVRDLEAGLADAMTVVGGHVAEGVAVERAIARAGESVTGPAGEAFADAAARGRTLRIGVRESFLGEGGPLAAVPSARARGVAALLGLATREGRPAGDVLLELADQLEDLRELEREATRRLATVTRTLSNTAALFGPLVGGATVALAAGLVGDAGTAVPTLGAETGGLEASGVPGSTGVTGAQAGEGGGPGVGNTLTVPVLGRIVGAYVILLSVVLTAIATVLERGASAALVAYRVGIALPTATATYLAAFVGAGLLL